MKPNELMIGDWVKLYVYDSALKPSKIVGIQYNSYRGKDYVDWVDCEVWDELSLNDIEPIPLTPEILEKNGFEKAPDEDGTECYRYYNQAADGYIKISLHNGGDGDWSIEIINYEKFDDNEIVYNNNFIFLKVHQLQHLFKLCKIEKEIIL